MVAEGRTSDLQGLRFTTTGYINGFPMTVLQLVEGVQTHDLAQGAGTSMQNTNVMDVGQRHYQCSTPDAQEARQAGTCIHMYTLLHSRRPQNTSS